MSDQTRQPTKVSADVYNKFAEAVEYHHGRTRGTLRSELEKAMLERVDALKGQDEVSAIHEINDKLDHLLGVFAADIAEGSTPPTHSRSAYARVRATDEKTRVKSADECEKRNTATLPDVPPRPKPNATTDDKSEYIALRVLNEAHEPGEGGLLVFTTERYDSHDKLRKFPSAVEDAYSFGKRARDRLVEASVDRAREIAKERLGARYPEGFPDDSALAWGPMLGRVSEKQTEEVEEEAEETIAELDNAKPE